MTVFTCAYGVSFLAQSVIHLLFWGSDWSIYFYYFFRTLYFLLSLQGWIFGIIYLESSVKSGEITFMTENQVKWIKWIGVTTYSAIIGVCLIVEEITWIIYFADNYTVRLSSLDARIYKTTFLSWSLMTLLNTSISVFGIYKINKTINDLKKLEPDLETNLYMQSIHAILLIL